MGDSALATSTCWTMITAHYAIMGGFAFDSRGSGPDYLPKGEERLTLTGEGVSWLFEHKPGLLPDITDAEIRDKSKASALAKFLVCLQALWFCFQCISRLAGGLPITLLEVSYLSNVDQCSLIY